ncbi:relaxase domain-containing protein [Escherichia coli]
MEGRLPDGADLSRMQDGSNKHRPGYDLTFSAPKSVSMMAMLGGGINVLLMHITGLWILLSVRWRRWLPHG